MFRKDSDSGLKISDFRAQLAKKAAEANLVPIVATRRFRRRISKAMSTAPCRRAPASSRHSRRWTLDEEIEDMIRGADDDDIFRRIVHACERDMEDFTAALYAENVDLDAMRARVAAAHSVITPRQRVDATRTAEISTTRVDDGGVQEALWLHDSWMEDAANTLQQTQEKEGNLTEDTANAKNAVYPKLDSKVDKGRTPALRWTAYLAGRRVRPGQHHTFEYVEPKWLEPKWLRTLKLKS